jgi:hypothetical protein
MLGDVRSIQSARAWSRRSPSCGIEMEKTKRTGPHGVHALLLSLSEVRRVGRVLVAPSLVNLGAGEAAGVVKPLYAHCHVNLAPCGQVNA